MLLEHVGHADAARRIHRAVERVLAEGSVRTPDLGGSAGTMEMTQAIIASLSA
ncbi:MAG: isocitrate/isopropylmalate family dehydrogenase [Gemmatimonadaceae bacterium]